jgi:HAD superfamily hydrolase (TIGR01509 family)
MPFFGSWACRAAKSHRCAATQSSDQREPQQHEAADDDEGEQHEHDRLRRAASLEIAEAPEGEEDARESDDTDDASDDDDADENALKLRIHVSDTNTSRPKGFPSRIAAAIFDFDETMIDLEAQHTAAYAALCRDMGSDYAQMPESFRHGSGRRVIDDIREMRDFFGWTEPVDDLFERRHRHFLDECRTADLELRAGVVNMIRALYDRGLTLAVTSSAVGDAIDEILRRFAIRECFSLIVEGRDVKKGKPDPEAYLLTARRLGIDPAHAIVFEDANVGVRAAKAAGMYCIAVRNPNAKMHQDLSAADLVLQSFEEFDARWVAAVSGRSPSSRSTRR